MSSDERDDDANAVRSALGFLIGVIAVLVLLIGLFTLDDSVAFVSHWLRSHS